MTDDDLTEQISKVIDTMPAEQQDMIRRVYTGGALTDAERRSILDTLTDDECRELWATLPDGDVTPE